MPLQIPLGQHLQPHALDAGRRPGEIPVDDGLIEADRLENLGAAIALNGRDTHLAIVLTTPFTAALMYFLIAACDRGLSKRP